jgi:hypothetical protein
MRAASGTPRPGAGSEDAPSQHLGRCQRGAALAPGRQEPTGTPLSLNEFESHEYHLAPAAMERLSVPEIAELDRDDLFVRDISYKHAYVSGKRVDRGDGSRRDCSLVVRQISAHDFRD